MVQRTTRRGYQRRTSFFLDLKACLVEAVRVYARYDIPDDKGETRRERNRRMDEYAPPFILPQKGKYLWEWYISLSDAISRQIEGYWRLIPPSEFYSWSIITGNIVYSFEYDIMMSMDRVYCEEINKEVQSNQSKREDEQKKQVENARNKTGRK